jgi:hypothetical protein
VGDRFDRGAATRTRSKQRRERKYLENEETQELSEWMKIY